MKWMYRARNVVVKDGDTIRADLDRGLDGTTTPVDLRLKDVWAPERGQTGHNEARAHLDDLILISSRGNQEWPIVVETFKTRTDHSITTLSRYVAIIWDASESVNVNALQAAWLAERGYPKGTGS